MAYAEKADMKSRYGEREINQLEEGVGTGAIAAALDDAAAEADSFIAARHSLPLPAGKKYPALTWISCDIARYRLWEGKLKDETDTVYIRYVRARKWLEDLAAGEVKLLDDAGEEPPLSGEGSSIVVLNRRPQAFSNRVLRKMDYAMD
ncbi:MAG: DUF1320 family protein [Deltaproteobacteria bacterium]|jgi:phage gp36-like protein|nr:DUF1320 family protein [Deltaproteobacteria bacterium]